MAMKEIRIENPEEPNRPLLVRQLSNGGIELRIGDRGITDATITLSPKDFDQLRNF